MHIHYGKVTIFFLFFFFEILVFSREVHVQTMCRLCAWSAPGPWPCPRMDVGEVHVRGLQKFVSQMSTFGDVHT
jgi:hypothetical protein